MIDEATIEDFKRLCRMADGDKKVQKSLRVKRPYMGIETTVSVSSAVLFGTPRRRNFFLRLKRIVDTIEAAQEKPIYFKQPGLEGVRVPVVPKSLYLFGSYLEEKEPNDIDLVFVIDQEEYERDYDKIVRYRSDTYYRGDLAGASIRNALKKRAEKIEILIVGGEGEEVFERMRGMRRNKRPVDQTRWLRIWSKDDRMPWIEFKRVYDMFDGKEVTSIDVNVAKPEDVKISKHYKVPILDTEAEVFVVKDDLMMAGPQVLYSAGDDYKPFKKYDRYLMLTLAFIEGRDAQMVTLFFHFLWQARYTIGMGMTEEISKKVWDFCMAYREKERLPDLYWEHGAIKKTVPWMKDKEYPFNSVSEAELARLFIEIVDEINSHDYLIWVNYEPDKRIIEKETIIKLHHLD